ncbi:Uncharacterised protein [Mycobacteroides abscessus subsp. abscessus]|nr:Uncharacterised protein [Mycobacteroides abscessus subsp. abscessus]
MVLSGMNGGWWCFIQLSQRRNRCFIQKVFISLVVMGKSFLSVFQVPVTALTLMNQ